MAVDASPLAMAILNTFRCGLVLTPFAAGAFLACAETVTANDKQINPARKFLITTDVLGRAK